MKTVPLRIKKLQETITGLSSLEIYKVNFIKSIFEIFGYWKRREVV